MSDNVSAPNSGEDAPVEEHPELELRVLEDDETVPPRPEEEVADVARAEPDPHEVRPHD